MLYHNVKCAIQEQNVNVIIMNVIFKEKDAAR